MQTYTHWPTTPDRRAQCEHRHTGARRLSSPGQTHTQRSCVRSKRRKDMCTGHMATQRRHIERCAITKGIAGGGGGRGGGALDTRDKDVAGRCSVEMLGYYREPDRLWHSRCALTHTFPAQHTNTARCTAFTDLRCRRSPALGGPALARAPGWYRSGAPRARSRAQPQWHPCPRPTPARCSPC